MAAAATTHRRARSAPARRPAPPTRIRWDRVGRRALLGVLGVILLLYIAPVSNWVRQSRTAEQGRSELRALEQENARLRARADDLARPDAVEREARRLGMVKAGERAYVVEGIDPSR